MIQFKLQTGKVRMTFFTKFFLAFLVINNPQAIFSQDTINPPPKGYDSYIESVPHGITKIDTFYSSYVGAPRRTRIILPPGYNKDSTYNVLYLLHGIGGDINEWYNNGVPRDILANLYLRGRIAPMILVLPNGRAMLDDSPGGNMYDSAKVASFANFEFELLRDLIPYIDTTYPVKPGRTARAIAGLSMGGGQALDFGLAHLDTFAWIGAFSPAPNTKDTASLIPDLGKDTLISGLWISCGDADGLFFISQNTHKYLTNHNIKHYYKVEPGKGHDWSVWRPGLYYFVQRIFGRVAQIDSIDHTGISHNINETDWNISYNPLNKKISVFGNFKIQKVTIYDMNGRSVLSELDIKNRTIDVSRLSKGVYMVVIFDGKKDLYKKVVKF